MLAEFRLIPGLNNLFDKLIWRKYTASNHVVHGQNENCDCSPVSRTTYLILLHTILILDRKALTEAHCCCWGPSPDHRNIWFLMFIF